jgi:hypothetical protein
MSRSVGTRSTRLTVETTIVVTQTIMVIVSMVKAEPIGGLAGKALGHVLNIIFQRFLKFSRPRPSVRPLGKPRRALGCLPGAVSFTVRAQLSAISQSTGASSNSLGVTSFLIRPAHCDYPFFYRT